MASNPENVALARRWFEELWGWRQTTVAHELLLPDSICHTDMGDMVGPQPFLDFHARVLADFPDLQVSVEQVLSEGDSVVVHWLMTFTHRGKPNRFQGATWIRYQQGKMIEGWDFWNSAGLAQLLSG